MSRVLVPKEVIDAAKRVVASITAGEFVELEAGGQARRVPAQAIQRVITEYGRTFVPHPDDASFMAGFDAVQVQGLPLRWQLLVDLWTVEESRSDLTLCLEAMLVDNEVSIEITDLRVM